MPAIAHADCGIADGEISEQQYSNADCYNNEEFYRISDPNKLDWSMVNLDKVNFDDKRIYQTGGFYEKLGSMDDGPKSFYYKKISYKEADLSRLEQKFIDINKFGSDVIPDKALNFKTSKKDDRRGSVVSPEEKPDAEEDFYRNGNDELDCNDCRLEFIKNKDGSYTIKTDKGSEVTITKYPSGTMFELELDGAISVRYPKEVKSIEVPAEDNVLVKIEKGQSIKNTPKEISINGNVLFEKGEKYLTASNYAEINNVEIFSGDKIELFFDGNDHPEFNGDFLSLSPSKRSFIIKTASDYRTTVNFYKGNPFLDVEEGDNLNINLQRSKMSVVDRASKGLINEVNLYSLDESSIIDMHNNDIDFRFEHDGLWQKTGTKIEMGSVPMVINNFNEKGERISVYNEYSTKLVISNFNEYAFLKLSQEQGYTYLREQGLPKGIVSAKIRYNSQIPYFGKTKGTVAYPYAGAENIDSDNALYHSQEGNTIQIHIEPRNKIALKRVVDHLENLPPETRETVNQVRVLDYNSFSEICGKAAAACAPSDHSLIFKRDTVSDIGNFEHEAAHSRTHELLTEEEKIYQKNLEQIKKLNIKVEGKTADEWDKDFNRIYDEMLERLNVIDDILRKVKDMSDISYYEELKKGMEKEYDKLLDGAFSKQIKAQRLDSSEDFNRLPRKVQEELKKSPTIRWKLVVGDLYGKNLGEKNVGGSTQEEAYLSTTWSDGSGGPRNGFVRAYGANNIHEDMSTFTEYVRTKNADFFKPLLEPNSPSYDKRYKEKLDILLSAGYISKKDYDKATKTK